MSIKDQHVSEKRDGMTGGWTYTNKWTDQKSGRQAGRDAVEERQLTKRQTPLMESAGTDLKVNKPEEKLAELCCACGSCSLWVWTPSLYHPHIDMPWFPQTAETQT